MSFVPLSVDLLSFRVEEDPEVAADWFIPRMRDYIALEPDGCVVLTDSGRPIGMVTSVCYERVGWIGWLYVVPAYRGQGCGSALMRHATGYCIARGMRTILLEAVPEAIPLYKRLGFREQFRTQHYRLLSGGLTRRVSETIRTRPLVLQDLAKVAEFDRRFFYDNRARALEVLTVNPTFCGFVALLENKIIGYVCLTEAPDSLQVGPLVVNPKVAAAADIAAALLGGGAAATEKPLTFRCPLVTPEQAAPLADLGARPKDYGTQRMFLGEPYPPEAAGILSLGCPGKG